jgi:hypothetical protein
MQGRRWMGRARRGPLAVLAGAALVLAGAPGAFGAPASGPAADAPGQPPPTPGALWPGSPSLLLDGSAGPWWSEPAPVDLAPSGLRVIARPAAQALVVDGAGGAWLHGRGHLARVDPESGAAEVWDVGDDVSLGRVLGIRASPGSGVWLLLPDRVRLFDGRRFVRDLPVPPEYRGGPEGVIADLVEVGPEVWLATSAGVARWAAGTWGRVRADQLTGVGSLAVDAAGSVWATAVVGGSAQPRAARFDGSGWTVPSAGQAPGRAQDLAADPTGGVLAISGRDVHRFDGRAWRRLPGAGVGRIAPRTGLAVTDDGVAWLLGDEGLARWGEDGWVRESQIGAPGLVSLAAAGRDVLVGDGSALVRLREGSVERVWSSAPMGPVASAGALDRPRSPWSPGDLLPIAAEGLVPVSRDEVWGVIPGYPAPVRFSADGWRDVTLPPALWRAPVLASDGAVWFGTTRGLVRVAGAEPDALGSAPVGGGARPGPDGGIWVLPPRWSGWWYADGYPDGPPEYLGIRQVRSDSVVTALPLPVDALSLTEVVAGADGSLWVTSCSSGDVEPCPTPPGLFRWDGAWAPVPYPGVAVRAVGVDDDGALWATLGPERDEGSGPERVLARHSGGGWVTVLDTGVPERMVLAAGGTACGMHSATLELVCVRASGDTRRTSIGLPGELRIAPDGSIWLADRGLLALLPVAAHP